MESPDTGVKIRDFENFDHLRTEVYSEWAFEPEINWGTEDHGSYPKKNFAYLYGFTYEDGDISQFGDCETFYLNKVSPGSPLFTDLWYAMAMTCEPFSVLMYTGSSDFPRLNEVVVYDTDLMVQRLDCEPGLIEVVNVPLDGGEETVEDTYEWDVDTYEEERFLGGLNY